MNYREITFTPTSKNVSYDVFGLTPDRAKQLKLQISAFLMDDAKNNPDGKPGELGYNLATVMDHITKAMELEGAELLFATFEIGILLAPEHAAYA